MGRHWRPFWLARAWNAMGHQATVIRASNHHLAQGVLQSPGLTVVWDVNFWLVKTPKFSRGSIGRLTGMMAFNHGLKSDGPELVKSVGAPDIVIASIPDMFYLRTARALARRFKAPFWVEVRDLWPDSMVALGMTPRWHPIVFLIGAQERLAYRSADRLVSLLAGAEPHMRARGLGQGRFQWIPNGVSDVDVADAVDPPIVEHATLDAIGRLKAKGKSIVVYAGAMGPPNALENVVSAAASMQSTHSHVHFILVGSGVSREQLEQQAASLSNVSFFDEVERPVSQAILRASDCAVINFRNSPLYANGISPNKLFDYCLSAPRSVIGCDAQALRGLENLVSMRCGTDDSVALEAALSQALASPPRSTADRVEKLAAFNYSRLAERYFSGL